MAPSLVRARSPKISRIRPGPVDDLALPRPLQVALLHRAELGVDDGDGDVLRLDGLANGLDLALAH